MKYIALRGFKLGPQTPISRPNRSGNRHIAEYDELDIDDEQLKHKDVQFFINSRPQYIVALDSEAGKKKREEGRLVKEREAKNKEESPLLVRDVDHGKVIKVHKKTMWLTWVLVILAIIGVIIAWIAYRKTP